MSIGRQTVFTTGDVARICKVAPRTVSKWFDAGQLRGYRIPGSQDRRIPRECLIEFLRQSGMPLGELEQVGPTMLVVGKGRMTLLAESMAFCAGEEMTIERCDTLFQAGIRLGTKKTDVVVVAVAANGLQETVPSIRALNDMVVLLGVREAGATSDVEGIDEIFPYDAEPELIVTRAIQLSTKMRFKN